MHENTKVFDLGVIRSKKQKKSTQNLGKNIFQCYFTKKNIDRVVWKGFKKDIPKIARGTFFFAETSIMHDFAGIMLE